MISHLNIFLLCHARSEARGANDPHTTGAAFGVATSPEAKMGWVNGKKIVISFKNLRHFYNAFVYEIWLLNTVVGGVC